MAQGSKFTGFVEFGGSGFRAWNLQAVSVWGCRA